MRWILFVARIKDVDANIGYYYYYYYYYYWWLFL